MAGPDDKKMREIAEKLNKVHIMCFDGKFTPGIHGDTYEAHLDMNVVMGRAEPRNDLERGKRAAEVFAGFKKDLVAQKIVPADRIDEVVVNPQSVMLSHSPGNPNKIHQTSREGGVSFTYIPPNFNGPTENVHVRATISIPANAVNEQAVDKRVKHAEIMASGGQSYQQDVADDRSGPGTRTPGS